MSHVFTQLGWCLPLYNLFGAAITLPWASSKVSKTGFRFAGYVNAILTTLALGHAIAIFLELQGEVAQYLTIPWLQLVNLDLSFTLRFSTTTMGATIFIAGLSLMAQFFTLGYMEKDSSMARFFALVAFFEAAITSVALSNSLLFSYALLEVLTLSTYLLVGFWYAQPLVVRAARDAFLTKRTGDLILFMGVVALSTLAGSLEFTDLYEWSQTASLSPLTATLLGLALIAGPIGKCAQFPLHLWLDEAMEGPSPASILRNSMVVTTGAFILIQLQPVLALSPIASGVLVVLGAMTAIGASLVAIAQIDIKRALSHTTSAYLGLVFVAVGLQATNAALLLLLAHGIAKALLFTGVGAIVFTTNSQNLTEMGGIGSRMPSTLIAFVVGTIGMVAFLPSGAFWAMSDWGSLVSVLNPYLVGVGLVTNGLTAFGLARIIGLIFAGERQEKTRRTPEVHWPMVIPQMVLAIVVILLPVMILETGAFPFWASLDWGLATAFCTTGGVGLGLGGAMYIWGLSDRPVKLPAASVQDLLSYDFYIDRIYRVTVVFVVGGLAKIGAWLDRYVIDGFVNLVGITTLFGGESLKYSNFGKLQLYVLTILVVLGLLSIVMGWPLSATVMQAR
ncbi:MAG: NAD(P)H-quinone oxidoreductase subunit F [Cyanobacteria bacterium J06639_1]